MKTWIRKLQIYYSARYFSPSVEHRSELRNIFQCNMVRTASTWLSDLFADPVVYRATGLSSYSYQSFLPGKVDSRPSTYRPFQKAFPARSICKMYNDYQSFKETPKPGQWRAVSVIRDPRDLLVSWYFSMKFSHALKGQVPALRAELSRLHEEDGLLFGIEHLKRVGVFSAMQDWVVNGVEDSRCMVLKYEDMTGRDQQRVVGELFKHCLIPIEGDELSSLLEIHAFKKKTGGRGKGGENSKAHYRKGVAGDWREKLSPNVVDFFRQATGDLVSSLGYEDD